MSTQRGSLVEESMSSIGSKSSGGKTSGDGGKDRIKIIAAVIMLVLGLGLIAYTQGMFDFATKPKYVDPLTQMTPEQKAKYEATEKARERLMKEIPPSGS